MLHHPRVHHTNEVVLDEFPHRWRDRLRIVHAVVRMRPRLEQKVIVVLSTSFAHRLVGPPRPPSHCAQVRINRIDGQFTISSRHQIQVLIADTIGRAFDDPSQLMQQKR